MTVRLGVMGGTFDPIHHGHLVAASEVAHLFSLDEVVFVPTGQPWQKAERPVTEAETRYLMTVIATADDPRFTVSRVDIEREGPTYTVDTLRDLHSQRPDAELFFITGADALGSILTWRDPHDVLDLAHLVAVTRPGHDVDAAHLPPDRPASWRSQPWPSRPPTAGSGSREGRPISYLVPAGVDRFIVKMGLYRAGAR